MNFKEQPPIRVDNSIFYSHTVTIKFTMYNVAKPKLSCIIIILTLGEYDPDPVLPAGDLTDPREHTTRHSQGYL